MPKSYTTMEVTRAICWQTMQAWDFDYKKRLGWEIYGANGRSCSDCNSLPGYPCVNLSDVRHNKGRPKRKHRPLRENRRPHEDRIDWDKVLNALKTRGYYKASIEKQIRAALHVDWDGTEEELTEDRPAPNWATGE